MKIPENPKMLAVENKHVFMKQEGRPQEEKKN